MTKYPVRFSIFSLLIVTTLLVSGVHYYRTRGIPYVWTYDNWSVGVYSGEKPFTFQQPDNVRNPVLTVLDVTDVNARFLADPFMVREGGT